MTSERSRSVAAVAAACNAAPAPVVLLDTCALLDLLRYVGRPPGPAAVTKGHHPATAHGVRLAREGLGHSQRVPAGVHLVVQELVPQEWDTHAEEVQKAMNAEIQAANDLVARLNDLGADFNPLSYEGSSFQLREGLEVLRQVGQVATDLLAASYVVGPDQDCGYRAYQRCLAKRAPAQAGKPELKDCTIIEHYLGVCAALDPACSPRLFISTNKSDYGQDNGPRLHADLAEEFGRVGLKWVQSFSALSDLLGPLGI